MKKNDVVKVIYLGKEYKGEVYSIYNDGITVNVKFFINDKFVITAFHKSLVSLIVKEDSKKIIEEKNNCRDYNTVILKDDYMDLKSGEKLRVICNMQRCITVKSASGQLYSISKRYFNNNEYSKIEDKIINSLDSGNVLNNCIYNIEDNKDRIIEENLRIMEVLFEVDECVNSKAKEDASIESIVINGDLSQCQLAFF